MSLPSPTTVSARPVPRWPWPTADPGGLPLVAAVGAGVLAAALLPATVPGIGWPLAGLAMVAGATIARWRLAGRAPHAGQPHDATPAGSAARAGNATRDQLAALAWAAVAVALLSVGAVRSAVWLFGLCLLGAGAATVLAVTAGRTARGLALGALYLPVAAGRSVAWGLFGAVALRRRRGPRTRLLPTLAVTAAVLLVFGALFASADTGFSRVLASAVPALEPAAVPRWLFGFGAGVGLVLAAPYLRLAPPPLDRFEAAPRRPVALPEWAIPIGALVILFAGFVAVQATALFGGAGYVRGPDGPDYAQHARGGFWQLLAITALTLLVIAVTGRVASRCRAVERGCLRGLLGALAVLTLVIVASALFRMHTYQEAYGFTRLRVLVSVVEVWLGVVFLLVLVAGIRLRARWLPRAVVATGLVALLALAALNPDRFIAERNIDRWQETGRLDTAYLSGLSADAAPALVCLPDPVRRATTARLERELATPDGWRAANLARATARDLLSRPCPE